MMEGQLGGGVRANLPVPPTPVLLRLDGDIETRDVTGKPFLNVERAHDLGFSCGLNLGEFNRVLGILFFLELDGFRFLFHKFES